MQALNGYISNNSVVVDRNLSLYNGKRVIVTILDDLFSEKADSARYNATDTDDAVKAAFGMWQDISEESSVEDTVRGLRRGRRFDI